MNKNEIIKNSEKVKEVEEIGRIYKIKLKGSLESKELFVKILKTEDGKYEPCMNYFLGSKPSDWYGYFDKRNSYEDALRGVLINGLQSYNPNAFREDQRTYENEAFNDIEMI